MDAVDRARSFVREHHPAAVVALLGGSHARGTATATSDLDIVVVDPAAEWAYRRTWLFHDVKVETFVYRDTGVLATWLDEQKRERKPTLFSLVGESIVFVDTDGAAHGLQRGALDTLQRGPGPAPEELVAGTRYFLTDAHDDLVDIAAEEMLALATVTAPFVLEALSHAHDWWVGRGKWMRRYAARVEPEAVARLDDALRAAARGDRAPMLAEIVRALDAIGGRLDETGPLVAPRPLRHEDRVEQT